MNAAYTKTMFQNKNALLLIITVTLLLALLYYILFINKQTAFFGKQPTQTINTLPVDNSIKEIIKSENPKETANKEHLAVEGETVKVVITLKDESFVFTEEYGKQEIRYGKFIQAYVNFDQLKKLGENPKIEKIVAPDRGEPLKKLN